MKILLLVSLISLPIVGASEGDPGNAVIGSLKTREYIVVINSSGATYTVKDLRGDVLANNLTVHELYNRYPSIGEILDQGIADDASVGPMYEFDPSGESNARFIFPGSKL